ncbi:hypothetical protein PVAND_011221 [Polypedilum vanderplanki]|uniref:Uncharacterized protein n=1 Tax=Polypedilum vanderplanki TaxID=319348 RepID=A0A9J6CIM4_POLVA|nr:hypothetical protein PVAND_011221 [Polypedilum vanderplanki]
MKLIGTHEELKKKEHLNINIESSDEKTTTLASIIATTTDYPFVIGSYRQAIQSDGKIKIMPVPVEEPLNSKMIDKLRSGEITTLPEGYVKIYVIPNTRKPYTID